MTEQSTALEAFQDLFDASNDILTWLVKNVDKVHFPQYDNLYRAMKNVAPIRAALTAKPNVSSGGEDIKNISPILKMNHVENGIKTSREYYYKGDTTKGIYWLGEAIKDAGMLRKIIEVMMSDIEDFKKVCGMDDDTMCIIAKSDLEKLKSQSEPQKDLRGEEMPTEIWFDISDKDNWVPYSGPWRDECIRYIRADLCPSKSPAPDMDKIVEAKRLLYEAKSKASYGHLDKAIKDIDAALELIKQAGRTNNDIK